MSNSSTSCNSSFEKDLLPPIYGVEMCVALVGNILALWLLVTKERKKNWHTGVVFSCNLIISDILYALTLPLLIHFYSSGREWIFGVAVCKIDRFLFICSIYVSIYFIMCISVNRYLGIVHPIFTRNRVRPKHAKIVSLLVWIFVAALSSPILYYSDIKNGKCSLLNKPPHKLFMYRVCMAVIGCFFPFLATFASYFGVLWVVCKNANITSPVKKKVSLLVGLVCVLLTVSFVPYHILLIWHFKLIEEKRFDCYMHARYQVSKALACLSMCLHAILYMAVCDSIRAVCCKSSSDVSVPTQLQITEREHLSNDRELID